MTLYGYLEFTSFEAAGKELSISYWEAREQIMLWKRDPDHLAARRGEKKSDTSNYRVRIAEVGEDYSRYNSTKKEKPCHDRSVFTKINLPTKWIRGT